MVNEKKAKDIEKIVFDALSNSKSLGVFPTPVDKILQYADLRVSSGVDLGQISSNLFAKAGLQIKRSFGKIRGVLDRRQKIVYLDLAQLDVRKRFVKLHETGHELCSWQGKLHSFLDDDETLDPDIKEQFEAEANYFASASLFQLGIFNDKMIELPLDMASAIHLSKVFGSSIHASLRRYVEKSKKRCALLVLKKDELKNYEPPKLCVRNYFQSASFTEEWGLINWGTEFDTSIPFVQDYLANRKHFKGEISIHIDNESLNCTYYYFNSGYNIFILMAPKGEKTSSKTTFIINT